MKLVRTSPRPWTIKADESPLDYEMEFWVVDANGQDVCYLISQDDALLVIAAVNAFTGAN